MSDYILVLVSAALVTHLILHREPVSRLRIHALGLSGALVIALGLTCGQLLQALVLVPLGLQALQLFLFLPLLALLAWGVPRLLARLRPDWPLEHMPTQLAATVVLLGLLLQASHDPQRWLATLAWGLAGGLGFWLALALFDDLRQRSDHIDMPVALRGLPIELLGAGVMAMAFSGFNGLFTQ
ncbi:MULTISPECIES: Rnf-Nqr domain containing protein [Pseudomonas]|uniref:Rnf-Nqr domain containing protein n=1 Tax=Pseudomonas TaxID=286 RepID=UPI001CE3DDD2|nr:MULTISPECIES: Rnf-Nqr domain containing protein [Pseudomonas]MCO7596895.1 electron transporter RnfA [Pseudomonas guariconensis]MCO7634622.1 electron transporter RnfA [Pseudomonas guariconensis]MCU7221910.1 electron transporter RnfA [Pseudomonas brassicacearum]